jgi:surface glycoprotein (TIGR04207 family)
MEQARALFLAAIMIISVVGMTAAFAGSAAAQDGGEITVNGGGNSLQVGIDSASSGDTIVVTDDATYDPINISTGTPSDLEIVTEAEASPTISSNTADTPAVDIDGQGASITGDFTIETTASGGAAVAVSTNGTDIAVDITGSTIATNDASQTGVRVNGDGTSDASVSISGVTFDAAADSTHVRELGTGGGVVDTAAVLTENENSFEPNTAVEVNNPSGEVNGNDVDGLITSTVQDAIINASRNATVQLNDGTYDENIVVAANADVDGETVAAADLSGLTIEAAQGTPTIAYQPADAGNISADDMKIGAEDAGNLATVEIYAEGVTFSGIDIEREAASNRDDSTGFNTQGITVRRSNVTVEDVGIDWFGPETDMNNNNYGVFVDDKGAPTEGVSLENVNVIDFEIGVLIADYYGNSITGVELTEVTTPSYHEHGLSVQEVTEQTIEDDAITGSGNDFTGGGTGLSIVTNKPAAVSLDGPIQVEAGDSLQTAVNVAAEGARVDVGSGNYNESVEIDVDGLTLEGAGADSSTITGEVNIGQGANSVSTTGVTIRGFTIDPDSGVAVETTIEQDSDVTIEDNRIEGAAGDAAAAFFQNPDEIEIRNNEFVGPSPESPEFSNTIGDLLVVGSGKDDDGDNYVIADNTFEGIVNRDQQPSGGNAIEIRTDGAVTVENNDFGGVNSNNGALIWIASKTTDATINRNNIVHNDGTGNGVIAESGTDVDATENWWGSESGPSGDGVDSTTTAPAPADGDGAAVSENVTFVPWLDAPFDEGGQSVTAAGLDGDNTATLAVDQAFNDPSITEVRSTFDATDVDDQGTSVTRVDLTARDPVDPPVADALTIVDITPRNATGADVGDELEAPATVTFTADVSGLDATANELASSATAETLTVLQETGDGFETLSVDSITAVDDTTGEVTIETPSFSEFVVAPTSQLGISEFDVTITDTTGATTDGISAVEYELENVGEEPARQTTELLVAGEVVASKPDTLAAGQTDQQVFSDVPLPAGVSDGDNVTVTAQTDDNSNTTTVTVGETAPPAEAGPFTVTDLAPASPTVTQGATVDVSANITNTGNADGDVTAALTVTGSVDANDTVIVAAGDTESVTLSADTSGLAPGDYTHAIATADDSAEGTLTVEAADDSGTEAPTVDYAPVDSTAVETDGLLTAISDWRNDELTTPELLDIIDAWRNTN